MIRSDGSVAGSSFTVISGSLPVTGILQTPYNQWALWVGSDAAKIGIKGGLSVGKEGSVGMAGTGIPGYAPSIYRMGNTSTGGTIGPINPASYSGLGVTCLGLTSDCALYGTVAGGISNTAGISNFSGNYVNTVAGGQLNAAYGGWDFIGAGYQNYTDGLFNGQNAVVGGYNNRIVSDLSIIGGGHSNRIGCSGFPAICGILSGQYNSEDIGGLNSTQFAVVAGGFANTADGSYSFIGSGSTNTATSGTSYVTIGGGKLNTGSADYSSVLGGLSNRTSANYTTVGGGRNNTSSAADATIAGGHANSAGSQCSIGGGDSNICDNQSVVGGGAANTASGSLSVIAGGSGNQATGNSSIVGGGSSNIASGIEAIILGGSSNLANATDSTVGGGNTNSATGSGSTISGGENNAASGSDAAVPGGNSNLAQGSYSVAAGYKALASAQGSFVWADSQGVNLLGQTTDQFLIRAAGGFEQIGSGVFTSTLTVQGSAFSVGASTLTVSGGQVGVYTPSPSTWSVFGVLGSTWNITSDGGFMPGCKTLAQLRTMSPGSRHQASTTVLCFFECATGYNVFCSTGSGLDQWRGWPTGIGP